MLGKMAATARQVTRLDVEFLGVIFATLGISGSGLEFGASALGYD